MILEDIEDPIKQKVLRELTLNPAAVERVSYPVATRNVIIRMRSQLLLVTFHTKASWYRINNTWHRSEDRDNL